MMVHQGKVIFEAYPGMTETDVHFWASAATTTVGLVSAMLAEEGKIDVSKPITESRDPEPWPDAPRPMPSAWR